MGRRGGRPARKPEQPCSVRPAQGGISGPGNRVAGPKQMMNAFWLPGQSPRRHLWDSASSRELQDHWASAPDVPSGSPCSAHRRLPLLTAQPGPGAASVSPCPHHSVPPTTVWQSCLKHRPLPPRRCPCRPLSPWPGSLGSRSPVPASPGSNLQRGWGTRQTFTRACWTTAQLNLLLRKPPDSPPGHTHWSRHSLARGRCHPLRGRETVWWSRLDQGSIRRPRPVPAGDGHRSPATPCV